ncbi:MAG: hypothetical protein AAF560_25010, partial [Acidobacteriota bacterium]
LRHLSLEARRLRGRAELELGEERQRRGILYVRFYGIPVGLEIQDKERDWKLIRPKRWFERRVASEWQNEPADEASEELGVEQATISIEPANDEPANDEPSGSEPTDSEPANGEPAGGESPGETLSAEEAAGGAASGDAI